MYKTCVFLTTKYISQLKELNSIRRIYLVLIELQVIKIKQKFGKIHQQKYREYKIKKKDDFLDLIRKDTSRLKYNSNLKLNPNLI